MKVGAKGGKKAPEKAPKKDAAAEKKPKRKSRGGANPTVALKQFFVEHTEKVVLGLMGLVALLLIYKGFSQPAMDNSPDTVRTAINAAKQSISASTWAEQIKQRYPEPDQFDRQATEDVNAVDLEAYAVNRPFHAPMQERRGRRKDPELFAPLELEVKAGYGAVAMRSETGVTGGAVSPILRNSPDLRPIPDSMLNRGGGGRRGEGGVSTGSGEKLESRFFVAVNGLIPYKKQFEEFEKAFLEANNYNFERDVPKYGRVEVERAEVLPDGKLGEWTKLNAEAAFFEEPARWSNRADELVDPTYKLGQAPVVAPLPPLVRRDISQWATHSKIPLDLTGEGGRSYGEGRGREGRMEEGGREERGRGEGAANWLGSANAEDNNLESREEMSEGPERGKPLIEHDYALVRYLDFTVVPGKTYRYRMQLGLDDPNNPSEGPKPLNSDLETDVVIRRNDAKVTYRLTPMSEPSPPVSVHAGARVLASEVTQPRTATVRGMRVEARTSDEPVAQVLALTWKANGPYDVPIPTEARRGAVLNGSKADAEAIDPVVNQIRKLSHAFVTETMVADIAGGMPLDSKGLTSPGFVLVMAPDGRLAMHSELDDRDAYQQNFIPPADPTMEPSGDGGEERGEGRGNMEEGGDREGGPRNRGSRGRQRPGRPARGGERGGE